MKYIDLLNRFWEANRADRFTTSERELYYYLLNECNHNYWRMPVACQTSVVCAVIGINRATLVRAREGLRSRGFIRFEEGVQNSRAPTYTILDTSRDTGSATASATAADTAAATARATSYTTQKSNTNTSSQKDAPVPIDELERRLVADREWHEQIVRQLAASGRSADADTLVHWLRQFFDYLRICKYEKREERECRSHFYNKLLKEYLNNGTDKKEYNDRRRGVGVPAVSPEEYDRPF